MELTYIMIYAVVVGAPWCGVCYCHYWIRCRRGNGASEKIQCSRSEPGQTLIRMVTTAVWPFSTWYDGQKLSHLLSQPSFHSPHSAGLAEAASEVSCTGCNSSICLFQISFSFALHVSNSFSFVWNCFWVVQDQQMIALDGIDDMWMKIPEWEAKHLL